MIDLTKIEFQSRDLLLETFGSFKHIEFPLNVPKVAAYLGLTLEIGTFAQEGISGVLKEKTIYVNSEDRFARQLYSIAYEIGNVYLHNATSNILYRSDFVNLENGDEQKREIHAFSLSLLMPRSEVRKYWQQGFRNVEDYEVLFGVSSTMAYSRLVNLGLISQKSDQYESR